MTFKDCLKEPQNIALDNNLARPFSFLKVKEAIFALEDA